MRILFLSHYFPPEVNAPANRTFEHAKCWAESGHEIHVVTCFPHHPHGRVFPGYSLRWYRYENVHGLNVHRVWTAVAPNRGSLRRAVNYLSFVPTAVWRALRTPRPDVVVATSPQFFVAVAGWLVARLRRVPWVFEVRDLWPESIAAVGAMSRASAVFRVLEWLELRLYHRAARVVCVTSSFVDNLARRGVSRKKLNFIPNGVIPEAWAGGDGAGFRKELGIGDREFVASYVGTVGMAHGIGAVLEAARELAGDRPACRFLVVGDGAQRQELEARARSEGLSNVHFAGLLPRARMPDVLAASDACLVVLKRSPLFRTVLPSKMFEAMAAGRPIILGVEGEARELLQRAGAGVAVAPEDPGELAAAVRRLAGDPELCSAMGARGKAFVEREFDRRLWAGRMLRVLSQVASGRAPAE